VSESTEAAANLDLLGDEWSVADLVDHLLNRGVVVIGSVTISVAGIDLMYLGLQMVFASVEALSQRRTA
jgi:hypothetical protein